MGCSFFGGNFQKGLEAKQRRKGCEELEKRETRQMAGVPEESAHGSLDLLYDPGRAVNMVRL